MIKSYAGATDQGPYLRVNEDGLDVDLTNGLYGIFDGFGCVGVGEKAVSHVIENIRKFYKRISGDPDVTLPFYFNAEYLLETVALINSAHYAHRELLRVNAEKAMSQRAGVSGLIMSPVGDKLLMVSIGSCNAWLLRGGRISKMAQEDTLGAFVQQTPSSPWKTAPMSAFGLFDEIHILVREVNIQKGDEVWAFSDGVHAFLSDEELLGNLMDGSSCLTDKIKKLFTIANDNGNKDNQTVLALKF